MVLAGDRGLRPVAGQGGQEAVQGQTLGQDARGPPGSEGTMHQPPSRTSAHVCPPTEGTPGAWSHAPDSTSPSRLTWLWAPGGPPAPPGPQPEPMLEAPESPLRCSPRGHPAVLLQGRARQQKL